MHPVLVEIPLPDARVPLAPALVVVAFAGLVVVLLGRRGRDSDLVRAGGLCAVFALVAAFFARGQRTLFGAIPVYSFGTLLSLAVLVGYLATLRLAARDGLPRRPVSWCYAVTVASGLLGARLLYVLTNVRDFHALGEVVAFREGGLAFYGGALGGALGSALYLRRAKVPWLAWADAATPALALGLVVGRLGCYLAGCDYGAPLGRAAPAWLARLGTFPRWVDGETAGSPAWIDHVITRGLSPDSIRSLPVHPAQLYESLGVALLVVALLAAGPRRPFRGALFLAFVAGYGALRYLLEIVRDDPERGFFGPAFAPAGLVTTGAAALALAFALGVARGIRPPRARVASLVLTIIVVGATYVVLRGSAAPLRLSAPQWLAIATSVAAALGWRAVERAADAAA